MGKKQEVPAGITLDSLYKQALSEGIPRKKWTGFIKRSLSKLVVRVTTPDGKTDPLTLDLNVTFGKLLEILATKMGVKPDSISVSCDAAKLAALDHKSKFADDPLVK